MTDYLPEVYQQFSDRFPAVKEAFDALGAAEHEAGPLGEKERRLIKLGIAVGAAVEAAESRFDGLRPRAVQGVAPELGPKGAWGQGREDVLPPGCGTDEPERGNRSMYQM